MAQLNLERIYEYRFRGISSESKVRVWREIANRIYDFLGNPQTVLDPAGGACEFINQVPAADRWVVDLSPVVKRFAEPGVQVLISDVLEAKLPTEYFNGVFLSNFLEHLSSHEAIATCLTKLYAVTAPGGRIAIMGPNFKYCYKDYFDCADHTLALTESAVAEHLFGAGFEVEKVIPRFLPYSFRSRLPASPLLVKLYLRMPWAWRILGKQFLVIGRKGIK